MPFDRAKKVQYQINYLTRRNSRTKDSDIVLHKSGLKSKSLWLTQQQCELSVR